VTKLTGVPGRASSEWALFQDWAGVLADLGGAAALSGWDRETLMPPGGAEGRAQQLGTLAALHHRELVREDAGAALEALAADPELDEEARAMVRVAARERDRATGVPEDLVRAVSEACSRCVTAWITARPAGDLPAFLAALRPVVELKRREAEAIGGDGEPYDALLEGFEPGARAATVAPVLADLRERLAPLVARAADRAPAALPPRTWAEDAQMALAHEVAARVGFDASAGVIARSAHPFTTTTHHGDVRFTTRLDPLDPIGNITAVLHEAGHALYEQGFPTETARTPLHDAPSLGAHESQSRFLENHVGRTAAFWRVLEPDMRRHFPEAMQGIDADALHRAASSVRPSPIRVEADEVTYNLHIVLRFELELALIRGELEVDDLPAAFDEGMERLLGIRPPSHADGVMQDIHWPSGLFGYFPTYTLGNLYAAQLAETCDEALGGLERAVEDGRFQDVLGFMRERVHRYGRRLDTPELMRRATGRELDADALIAHLGRVVDRT
jgi:carboxypeptidase Taq